MLTGFEAAYTELERIRRHGFTESELERAKQSVMKMQELAYNNRNDRKNGQYVKRYLDAFHKNAAMPDAETEWKLDSAIIVNIPLQMINQVMAQYITDHNQVLVAQAPKKEGLVILPRRSWQRFWQRLRSRRLHLTQTILLRSHSSRLTRS